MVSLSNVLSSNSLISSTLPPGLVAVFVGGTSGIGEITLKKFAMYARQPRAYFIGRSQDAADNIVAKCKTLNPSGEFIFVKADVSLIRNVDEVCKEIKAKEKAINILFLSAGLPSFDRSETSEHLHLLSALNYYSRIRFITNLLPLLQYAPGLRRVVFVAGGSKEGPLDPTDFQALRIPLASIRGHLTSLVSLGLETVAKSAPDVSFIHDYPGTVKTTLLSRMPGMRGLYIRSLVWLLGYWICVPIEESGERHLYLATSAKFPPLSGRGNTAVSLGDRIDIAKGMTGRIGSGVYSVGWDCESSPPDVLELLAGFRDRGMVEEVWRHTEGEFKRIMEEDGNL